MGNKFCVKCGKAIDEGSAFCNDCMDSQNNNTISKTETVNNANIGFGDILGNNSDSIAPKYTVYDKKGLGGLIFGVIVSVALIFGGLSGQFVLRGTNSSTALVVVGIGFLVWDIIKLIMYSKAEPPKGFAMDNSSVVIKATFTPEAKKRAKELKINLNEYAVRAISSIPSAKKLEGLGVAYSFLNGVSVVFVSGSRDYLENELLPTFRVEAIRSEYLLNINVENISYYNTQYTHIGLITDGKIGGTGNITNGINYALNKKSE